jgi:hypothetical protein
MKGRSALAVTGLSVAAVLGGVNPANADPPGGLFTVVCDNGNTYEISLPGNGVWRPGHDLGSTSILVPVSFGESHFVLTDAEGNVLEDITQPSVTKGATPNSVPDDLLTSCTFTTEQVEEDPDLGLVTFTGEGTVVLYVTPVSG